jgi:DNA-binding CsgD family transcriptional regulator
VTLASDLSAGRWTTIAERVDAFVDQPAEFGGAVLDARSLQGALLASTGSATEATRVLRSVIHDAEELGVVWPLLSARATLARLQLTIGDVAAGREQAVLALGLARATGLWAWAGEAVQCIVEASVALGDVAQLEPLVEELAVNIAGANAPLAHAALLSCRAILAQHAGGAEVEQLLAEAESVLHGAGVRLVEGRATERLGRFRLARGDDSASSTLESALGIFGELGARRDFSRVSRTMREHGIAIPSRWRGGRRALGVELSQREREVAELAAAGLTNKEIATELFLSMRTVESHMSKALQKLGAGSRRDLAEALQVATAGDGP